MPNPTANGEWSWEYMTSGPGNACLCSLSTLRATQVKVVPAPTNLFWDFYLWHHLRRRTRRVRCCLQLVSQLQTESTSFDCKQREITCFKRRCLALPKLAIAVSMCGRA